ncbi:metal-sensitive transcriptional regulator [Pseudobacillus badius]|uniref:metal-sensitive transcriptional regulator n=1 Tax=Bacillus badius TaxID=1455 RepID=UPI0007B06EF9|nr:metal-sensitive transcriptional regulator [Bacillus badius]KZO00232.1 cytoplasmic protein [Bacillus badius]MED0668272.1 metal-sensitive transcriptional regulator [Bacillus badius]OCS86396.1 cytoplasmic protein [Bacillus badius]OVE52140.1 cytoplasmic protein [Bacillus badius]TDW03847.1 DNA-binding FrmR family transcriptional regulator [Bacillus badius]
MEYGKDLKNRLKRIEGQVRGIMKMMEEGEDCTAVVTQLSAIQGAVGRAAGLIVSRNLEQCIRTNIQEGEPTDDLVKEAVNLLVKSR